MRGARSAAAPGRKGTSTPGLRRRRLRARIRRPDHAAAARFTGASELRVDLGGRRINVTVVSANEKRHVFIDGVCFVFAAIDPLFHAGSGGGAEGGLTAPMPGKVIALIAPVGAKVEKGAPLLILEAMKMEHTIAAPAAGTVKAFRFNVGEQVSDGAELVEFEAEKK
jgi:3-methylcrotonyl-CoA carboxylase alpha subunit